MDHLTEEKKSQQEEQPSVVTHLAQRERGARRWRWQKRRAKKSISSPSFGAQLFMGNFRPDMLYPFPEQDPEDKKIGDAFIAKLSKYLEANLDPEEVDRTRTIPKNVIEELGTHGGLCA